MQPFSVPVNVHTLDLYILLSCPSPPPSRFAPIGRAHRGWSGVVMAQSTVCQGQELDIDLPTVWGKLWARVWGYAPLIGPLNKSNNG